MLDGEADATRAQQEFVSKERAMTQGALQVGGWRVELPGEPKNVLSARSTRSMDEGEARSILMFNKLKVG